MREFKIEKNPYGNDSIIHEKDSVKICWGYTALVGCNGAGKSDMLRQIRDQLKRDNVPCLYYAEDTDGRRALDRYMMRDRFDLVAQYTCSSEGERVALNLGILVSQIRQFCNKYPPNSDVWILIDAIDSGSSIDRIREWNEFVNGTLFPDVCDKELYIVVAGNSYELTRGVNDCIDVINCETVVFRNYDEFSDFILKSRDKVYNRYNENGDIVLQ